MKIRYLKNKTNVVSEIQKLTISTSLVQIMYHYYGLSSNNVISWVLYGVTVTVQ